MLEHIENDRQALTDLFRMLRPGGHFLIFVPALQALMSEINLIFDHYRRYNLADLSAKVAQTGGEVTLCRHFDLLGALPSFVLNKLMGLTRFNPSFIHGHDKFIAPISRAVERTISPPIGKNLTLVGRQA